MIAHTPGPWHRAMCNPEDGEITRVIESNVAVKAGWNTVVALCGNPDNLEAIANANLIAAAPDLLAACEGVLDSIFERMSENNRAGYRDEEAMLRAAIAKAKGEA